MLPSLVFLHVAANLVWIGSVVATGWVLAGPEGTQRERGLIALKLYRQLATPAFGVSFVAGLVVLAHNYEFYLVQTHFMHAKLTVALAVIGLHHVIGAWAKRAARDESRSYGAARPLAMAVVAGAAIATWLVVTKPF
jgi:putative membrane protein